LSEKIHNQTYKLKILSYFQNFKKSTKQKTIVLLVILLVILFSISLPNPLFNDPLSTIIEDSNGELLGAQISNDGQWRFPSNNNIPDKFEKAITCFEDKRFFIHFGIDPIAFSRAMLTNIKKREIVSGGSTITMQVLRLSRKGKPRTIWQKLIEIYLAFRLECSFSKKQILSFYASNAPFGGNVVGIDAASWRYFGRNADKLSWAEAALLAVLPNSPALIHPGKNRQLLTNKRNRLLKKMFFAGYFDLETLELSIAESIPEKPKPFPLIAQHLLAKASKNNVDNTKITTTINIELQKKLITILDKHHSSLKGNGINNLAALIIDVETGGVKAYVGNIGDIHDKNNASQVDVITSSRSTGSILKPFLYAAMLHSGEILPTALVPDIPTRYGEYAPQNFNLGYDGAVPAKRAIARSLNVPAVKMLQQYGVSRFHFLLKKLGMTTITHLPDYYGLSLILGGAEGSLWDLTGIYASMARTLNHFNKNSGLYDKEDFHPPIYKINEIKNTQKQFSDLENTSFLSAGAIWLTFDAMIDVERPTDESNWQLFNSSQKIAWKTGTSFGFRDGWAIGVTPNYVVGVWVGNADGEGRPDLTGINTAAPILFDIFNSLSPSKYWFSKPFDDMGKVAICRQSGYLASELCENIDSMWIPSNGIRFPKCKYHQLIHLDKTEKWRVNSDCESPMNMVHRAWFVLPPAMEWYYKSKNTNYKPLPPFKDGCNENFTSTTKSMEIIYPYNLTKIFVPTELDGKLGSTVFEIVHRKPNTSVFWYIDNQFVGETKNYHRLALNPKQGKHLLTLTDEYGEIITRNFEILQKRK